VRVLLIGYRGQLGSDLRIAFEGEELLLRGKDDLPVEDETRVREVVLRERPELIINCAAFHRVDDCENQVELAFATNVHGVRNLALAAREVAAVLVHFSTDYVYDSDRRGPYGEDVPVCPRSIYGVSKASGEIMLQSLWEKHFIFRVSGLYGYAGSREKGTNFVEMMIGFARQGKPIRVVNDQVLTPTATADVAAAVRRIAAGGRYGLYHLTNAGECSWYDFTCRIMQYVGLEAQITPVPSDAFPTRARRPAYSVLDNARLRSEGWPEMPHWHDALQRYVSGREAAGRV
jgi:dTDP-4-dehydrorhamnose reductase